MPTTLKQRVAALEQQLQDLATVVRGSTGTADWRQTFGASAGDAGFDEMIRLGREVRSKLARSSRTIARP
jgi:hypothetical protein